MKKISVLGACLALLALAACNQTTSNTGRDPGDNVSNNSGGADTGTNNGPAGDSNGSPRGLMKRR